MEEVLKIFIEYFENNNLPEIKDWYEVKWQYFVKMQVNL